MLRILVVAVPLCVVFGAVPFWIDDWGFEWLLKTNNFGESVSHDGLSSREVNDRINALTPHLLDRENLRQNAILVSSGVYVLAACVLVGSHLVASALRTRGAPPQSQPQSTPSADS